MLIPALLEYPMEQLLERCTMRPGRYQEDGLDAHLLNHLVSRYPIEAYACTSHQESERSVGSIRGSKLHM